MRFPPAALVCLLFFVRISLLTAQDVDFHAAHGTYFGLIGDGLFDHSGYLRMTVTRTGRATVAVKLGHAAVCVVFVGWDGTQFISIPGGDATMTVRLILTPGPDSTFTLIGDVTDDGVTLPVHLVNSAEDAAGRAGSYTFIVGQSQVADVACGSMRVADNGTVRSVLALTDGRTISVGGRLGTDGQWPLFGTLAQNRTLSGAVNFAASGDADCHGTLDIRAGVGETNAQAALIGSRYLKKRKPALIVPQAMPNTSIAITPSQGRTITRGAILTERNAFLIPTSDADKTSLLIERESGLVTGRVSVGDNRRSLRGALLQSRNRIEGFINGTSNGTFTVTPRERMPASASPFAPLATSASSSGTSRVQGSTTRLQ